MALQEPLTITKGAKTVTLTQLPTKRFFKSVLFIRVPIDVELAKVLGVGFLYTDDGTLRPFKGTIDPQIVPFVGASLEIVGSVDVNGNKQIVKQSIVAEQVCNFRFSHNDEDPDEEKEVLPLVMSFRVHQREPAQDVPVETIIEESVALQRFLANLNTSHYGVSIIPRQGTLFTSTDVIDTSGLIPKKMVKTDYHIAKSGRRNIIQARIMSGALDHPNGFVGGWQCDCVGFATPSVGAVAPMLNGPAQATQHEAFLWAASELLFYCKSLETANEVEKIAVEDVIDWCKEVNPALKDREHLGPRAIDKKVQ